MACLAGGPGTYRHSGARLPFSPGRGGDYRLWPRRGGCIYWLPWDPPAWRAASVLKAMGVSGKERPSALIRVMGRTRAGEMRRAAAVCEVTQTPCSRRRSSRRSVVKDSSALRCHHSGQGVDGSGVVPARRPVCVAPRPCAAPRFVGMVARRPSQHSITEASMDSPAAVAHQRKSAVMFPAFCSWPILARLKRNTRPLGSLGRNVWAVRWRSQSRAAWVLRPGRVVRSPVVHASSVPTRIQSSSRDDSPEGVCTKLVGAPGS